MRRCLKIERPDLSSQALIVPMEGPGDEAKEWMITLENEVGMAPPKSTFVLNVVVMSEADIEALPEFQGW